MCHVRSQPGKTPLLTNIRARFSSLPAQVMARADCMGASPAIHVETLVMKVSPLPAPTPPSTPPPGPPFLIKPSMLLLWL